MSSGVLSYFHLRKTPCLLTWIAVTPEQSPPEPGPLAAVLDVSALPLVPSFIRSGCGPVTSATMSRASSGAYRQIWRLVALF